MRWRGADLYIFTIFVLRLHALLSFGLFGPEVFGIYFLGVFSGGPFRTADDGLTLYLTFYLSPSNLYASCRSYRREERRDEQIAVRRALDGTGLHGPSSNGNLGGHPPGTQVEP